MDFFDKNVGLLNSKFLFWIIQPYIGRPILVIKCSQKSTIDQHVRSEHERKKPFKCDICDYISSQRDYLKHHVLSVHEGKKTFKSDVCDYECC